MTRTWSTHNKVYSATLKRDLFGDWVIFKYWGPKKNATGQTDTECISSYQEGVERLAEIGDRCIKGGLVERLEL